MHKLFPVKKQGGRGETEKKEGNAFERVGMKEEGGREGKVFFFEEIDGKMRKRI